MCSTRSVLNASSRRLVNSLASSVFVTFVTLLAASPALAATREVGPGKTYEKPCAAIAAADPGDTIEIVAGTYTGDVCGWSKAGLTIRGVGGRAKIDAGGQASQGKGTWVVSGNDTTIEHVEMFGAAVPDHNGAALRLEGSNATLRDVFLHDNENGILGGAGELLIESSEFARNGNCDDPNGCAHNMYIAQQTTKLTVRFSYIHDAHEGHEIKSRAQQNFILFNRISDENGTASYSIELPNGGTTVILGNVVEQGAKTENPSIVSYGMEGLNHPGKDLYVVHNTFVNTLKSGMFVQLAGGAANATLTNNVFFGGGTITNQGSAVSAGNFTGDPSFTGAASFDFRLGAQSPCIDVGVAPGMTAGGFSLVPASHYVHPLGAEARVVIGMPDVGAFELGAGTGVATPDGGGGNGGDGGGSGNGNGNGNGSDAGDGTVDEGGDDGCALAHRPSAGASTSLVAVAALVGLSLMRANARARRSARPRRPS